MKRRAHNERRLSAAGRALPFVALLCLSPAQADPDRPVPQSAQDLAWGEVLFDFYQQRHVPAITRVLVARERAELVEHDEEAELVLGGLYLDYGMHQRAAVIFERLLEERASPEVHDQAWFFLARIRYSRGDTEGAGRAVDEIGDALPRELQAQRYDLQSRILLDLGRPAEAARLLADADLNGGWHYFGQYNLGVALIRSGESERGQAYLDEVGRAKVRGNELATLRDRANLALGYERLLLGNADGARDALNRVRLDSPYTTRALLGAGWADAGQDDYRRALTPWKELGARDHLDIAVQESLLAVPYAYGQLGANLQAVEHYQYAVDTYEAELLRLDLARDEVAAGTLVRAVLAAEDEFRPGAGEIDRYLLEMLAGERFRVATEDLRETARLRRLLEDRAESMVAFEQMLVAQRERFSQHRPAATASVENIRLDTLRSRYEAHAGRLARISEERDALGLANARERDIAERLAAVRSAAANDPEASEEAARERFLSGVLYWQINATFATRLRQAEKALAETGRALETAAGHVQAIRAVGAEEPARFSAFDDRIAAAVRRLETLRRRTSSVILAQSRYLEDLAVVELVERRERVTEYLSQARFALAASYDRAAVAEASP